MIRVVIVDDQPVVRAGIARILAPADGFEVVAECADGDEVPDAVAAARPDLVVMDLRMRRVDGATATRRLREARPDGPPVLVLTTFDDDDALWGALEAGAAGFLLKDSPAELLIAAAAAVAHGAAWLDPAITARVLHAVRRARPGARGVRAARLAQLTEREHDVLLLMARGATNGEVAAALIVSEATVKSHVGSIFVKLGVRDRAAAIVYAYDHGVVAPDPGAGPLHPREDPPRHP